MGAQHEDHHGPATRERTLPGCPECRCSFLQPNYWEGAGKGAWSVTLECPNCWLLLVEILDEDTLERFDRDFDRGVQTLAEELRRLTAANMADEADRFAAALAAGAIQPMDF